MKKVILTGIKPTGVPHLGNYLGAIKPALEQANDTSFFFIADYHAINQTACAKTLRETTKQVACIWLACGLDPQKTVFYKQSDVPEIFELATILMGVTPKGLMDRAHAYKAAKDENRAVNMGLYTYPILMAADILIMNTAFVPVGQDQQQHVEIAADIAKAFNAVYGKTLVEPQFVIKRDVGTIMGLDGRKMSKSYNNVIPLFCDEAELLKSIKRIATDSTAPDAPKDRGHLIFQLYKHFTNTDLDNKIGWGDAKQKLFEAINAYIAPMREKYNYYMTNFSEVDKILSAGSTRARKVARETMDRVRKSIGVQ